MKVKSLFFLCVNLCLLLMAGCSNGATSGTTDKDVENIDKLLENTEVDAKWQWDGIEYDNPYFDSGETTNGMYMYRMATEKVEYFDYETGTKTVLCSLPECKHNSSKCNAFFKKGQCGDIENGYLYFQELQDNDTYSLIRCDLSGMNRTEVVQDIHNRLDEEMAAMTEMYASMPGAEYGHSTVKWQINGGELFVVTCIKGTQDTRVFIDKYDINTGEYVGNIFNYVLEDVGLASVQEMYEYDGKLYLMFWCKETISRNEYYTYYRIEEKTGNVETVENEDLGWALMYDDKLLFQGDINTDKVYIMDWSGNMEETEIEITELQSKELVTFFIAGEYIYMRTLGRSDDETIEIDYDLQIYDKEIKYIDTIDCTEPLFVQGGNVKVLLVSKYDKYHYIDPAQIGSGNIEVKEYIEK